MICNTYTFVVTLQKNMQVTSLPNIQHHTSLPRRLKMWALHGLPGSRSPGGWRLNTFPVFWPNRFRSRRRKKEDKPSRRWQDKQVGPQPLTACDSEDEEIDNIVFFCPVSSASALCKPTPHCPKHTVHLAESASKQHQLTKSAKLLILMNAERVIPTTL